MRRLRTAGAAIFLAALSTACASPASEAPQANAAMGDAPAGGFLMPSGNIGCYLTATQARCDINRKSWLPPSKPADCGLAYGFALAVADSAASFLCAGDSVLQSAGPILGYGQSRQAGNLRCTSEPNAVKCENVVSGHGFTLAREQYDLW
ncbi:DUF6636 domain-containing protein [Winogradskya humida]|nr:DUF6636 domain-containing protein [Actinoplanes humidus]